MNRGILFRGLRTDGKGWVYGDLQQNFDCFKIREKEVDCIAKSYVVESESVGQFTGLTDKNGNKIFEGDKLRDDWFNDLNEIVKDFCIVVWDLENGQWAIDNSYKKDGSSYTNLVEYLGHDNLEAIGNIHEK